MSELAPEPKACPECDFVGVTVALELDPAHLPFIARRNRMGRRYLTCPHCGWRSQGEPIRLTPQELKGIDAPRRSDPTWPECRPRVGMVRRNYGNSDGGNPRER